MKELRNVWLRMDLSGMNYDLLNQVAAGLNQAHNMLTNITGLTDCAFAGQNIVQGGSPEIDPSGFVDVVSDMDR